jgi:hypothetical protein
LELYAIVSPLPLESLQPDRHLVTGIWTAQFYGVSLPPGHITAELKGLYAGEDIVIERSTKTSSVMDAYLKAFPNFMICIRRELKPRRSDALLQEQI